MVSETADAPTVCTDPLLIVSPHSHITRECGSSPSATYRASRDCVPSDGDLGRVRWRSCTRAVLTHNVGLHGKITSDERRPSAQYGGHQYQREMQ